MLKPFRAVLTVLIWRPAGQRHKNGLKGIIMARAMQRILSIALTTVLLIASNTPGTAWAGDEVSPLQRALGGAFYAKAELALLKGQLNMGKVYLAAAHKADPGISLLALKAMDMMHKDFPFVQEIVPGYRGGWVVFSGDQKFAAFSSGRSTLVRFELDTGEVKKVQTDGKVLPFRLEISRTGRYVAVSDHEGNLALFDIENEKQVGSFSLGKETVRGGERIEMDFSPDEKTIAAYYGQSKKRAIYFLRTEDMAVTRTFPVDRDVRPIRYVGDESLLLGMVGKMVIVDSSTFKVRKSVGPVPRCADADYLAEKNLVVVGYSGAIHVFNTETQQKVAEYQAASHNIVLVRYLPGGRYIVYASPKGESGIIDCASGKVLQIFDVGRGAMVSTGRYLLFAQGKVIDLSACRRYEGVFVEAKRHASFNRNTKIPDNVDKAVKATLDKAIIKGAGRRIVLAAKSDSGKLGAFSTSDGRTFIYDYDKAAQADSVSSDITGLTAEVKMVVTDIYRVATDLIFFRDDSHLVRLCKTGNGMDSAVEVYSLLDGKRNSLRMDDPPVSVAIVEGGQAAIILDRKNRVFLSTLPSLDCKIELLGATQISRQIHVDQQTKTLVVKTGEQIDSYDLRKVSADATIPTYEDAVKRYGLSLNESEPLWPLVHP